MADNARVKDDELGDRFETLQREVAALAKKIEGFAGGSGANGASMDDRAARLARKGKKAMRYAVNKGKAAISGVESTVSANPLASVAVAFGVGVLLGRLIRR